MASSGSKTLGCLAARGPVGCRPDYPTGVATLRFSDLDLYALLDSDSDEARTFTTYLGYWVSLAEHIQENYTDDVGTGILAELRGRRAFVRMASRPKPSAAAAAAVRSLLLNGWTSELRLHLIDASDTGRLWLANHGAPVDSYYATSRHASAFLVMHDGSAPTTHRGLLNAMSAWSQALGCCRRRGTCTAPRCTLGRSMARSPLRQTCAATSRRQPTDTPAPR